MFFMEMYVVMEVLVHDLHDQITNLARPNTFIYHPIDGEFTCHSLQGLLHDTKMPKTSEMIPSHPARM